MDNCFAEFTGVYMFAMDNASDKTKEYPVIDRRLLAAAERNGEYLGLTEWLEQFAQHQPPLRPGPASASQASCPQG